MAIAIIPQNADPRGDRKDSFIILLDECGLIKDAED